MRDRHGRLPLVPVMVLALLLGAAGSCSRQTGGPPAPAVVLDTLEGSTLDFGTLDGSPALVVFFAIDNPLALDELGRLESLADDLSDRGLVMVAVALSSERPELVRTIVNQRRFLFPVVLDPEGTAAAAFGDVDVTPTVFVIAPGGRVAGRVEGRTDIAALRATIKSF